MSANNSRLSPRQKMINLMYIVFLAMVAMNVSGDVLEGFKHVEDALDASNAGAQSRNQKLYQEFDLAREKNPEKVSRWYNHAQEVRTSAEQLVAFLDSLKLEIVRYADGKDGDPNDIENRENLEAVNQVMLSPIKGEGAILRKRLEAYKEQLVAFLPEADARVVANYLNTSKTGSTFATWEDQMFENIPVAAAVTILAKLQGDVRNAEGQAVESLMQSVDRGDVRVNQVSETAEETATQTVAAEEAEQMGVSEDAEAADSAMTYFTVLLLDRMGSLFECQRQNVYWETARDHVTIHKTSPEHALILNAGCYDVSARLLPENLRVDDGWVARKNPGVIVKIVDGSVLGGGVGSDRAARALAQSLRGREGWAAIDAVKSGRILLLSQELLEAPYLQTAAMVMIAKTANPALLADVDLDDALRMLMEEATGTLPTGVYFYCSEDPAK